MLKHRMFCIVTPLEGVAPQAMADRLQRLRPSLDRLFATHGGIHYASFTLLPASPAGTSRPSGASLSLALAVDPEKQTAQIVARLLQLDPQLLAQLYEGTTDDTSPPSLLRLLARQLQGASGGYVGARDRSVAQIAAEARLVQHLREKADAMNRAGLDARTLAARLAAGIDNDPAMSWANRPAPTGRWRASVRPAFWRLAASGGYLVLTVGLMFVLLGLLLIGWLDEFAAGSIAGLWRIVAPQSFAELLAAPVWSAAFGGFDFGNPIRAIGLGLFALLALLAGAALLALAGAAALIRVPPQASKPRLAFAATVCALIGIALLSAVFRGLMKLATLLNCEGCRLPAGSAGAWVDWLATALALCALALASFASIIPLIELGRRLLPPLKRLQARLEIPRPAPSRPPYGRLHQTAPSIDACEAEWVDRTAVMISLTEIRRPYWLFANAARFFLWFISSLGWHYYSEGKLGGVSCIQFAHWHVIDNGRRMYFCANFDGDFGGYLDQFITGRFALINLIWGWTRLGDREGLPLGGPERDVAPTARRDFPRRRLLLFSGCRSEQQFKAYARDSMLPFQYHFAAYDLGLPAILGATQVRDALSAERSIAADDLILRCLDS